MRINDVSVLDRHDVFERLPDLRDKAFGKLASNIPADDATRHDERPSAMMPFAYPFGCGQPPG